jgi:hypothetical protein
MGPSLVQPSRRGEQPETKLEREHDSGDGSNPEAHCKNAEPKLIDLEIYGILSSQPNRFAHC